MTIVKAKGESELKNSMAGVQGWKGGNGSRDTCR